MKTVLVILTILFIFAGAVLAVSVVRFIGPPEPAAESGLTNESDKIADLQDAGTGDKTAGVSVSPETPEISQATETTTTESREQELSGIKIDIYLDGDRKTGIYMGRAEYGLASEEASKIYGNDYLNSGFSLKWDRGGKNFEPGSTHYIYFYTGPDGKDDSYIRREIKLDGESMASGNINLYLERPTEKIVEGKVTIGGWAVDTDASDNTNIDRIEIYLDGPRGFGKLAGTAKYGTEREDVAEKFGNSNYKDCGFKASLDTGSFEPGSKHSIYVYAISKSGQFQLVKKDILIKGVRPENKSSIYLNTNLGNDYNAGLIEISGWVVNIDYQVQRVVFVSDQNGNEDIFSMNIDGTDLKQLTDGPGSELYPSVSKEGNKIVYSSDINGVWQIMVMNWDGSGKKQLTFGAERSGDPSWSFDDEFIYFEKFLEENWELYKMKADGTEIKRLTINPLAEDWHPYGHTGKYKILYESGLSGNFDIFIMDDDGTNIKKLIDIPFEKRVPSISRDGKHILFQGQEPGDRNVNIYIMDSDGQNLKKLTSGSKEYGHAIMSPDNQHIIYEGLTEGQKQLFIMDIDGSEKIQITQNEGFSTYMPDFIYILKK